MLARRLFSYSRTAKTQMALVGLILLLATLIELLQPWPIKWLLDYVFARKTAPPWLQHLWPAPATASLAGGVAWVCISILVLAVVYRLATLISQLFLLSAGG